MAATMKHLMDEVSRVEETFDTCKPLLPLCPYLLSKRVYIALKCDVL